MDEIFLPKDAKRKKLQAFLKGRERGFTKRLATYCGVDPRTPLNWTRPGKAWPVGETEERLWEFFHKVQQAGIPPRLPVNNTHSEDAARRSLQQYRELLAADAPDPDARARLLEVKEHLQNQIQLFYTLMRLKTSQKVPTNEP